MDKEQRMALADLMRRGDGMLTTEQCRAAGVDDRALSRAVAGGELRRLRRRVVVPPGAPATFLRDLKADIASCQRPAYAAESSALEVMGLRPHWLPLRREVLVLGTTLPLIRGGVAVHRTRVLDRLDTWRFEGVDCTTPARTLIDLYGDLSPVERLRLLDDVASSPECDPGILHHRASALQSGRAGVARLAELTGPGGAQRFKSDLERAGLELLRQAGVMNPLVNVVPRDAPNAGVTDVVSETDRLIVDFDGLRFHAGPRARQRDNDKGNAAAIGRYFHLRFTYEDVMGRGSKVIATVREGRAVARRLWLSGAA